MEDTPKENDQSTTPGASSTQKYIRTFAGDMAIAEQGGKPDLKPFVKEGEEVVPEKIDEPVQTAEPHQESRFETLARLRAKAEKEAEQPLLKSDQKPLSLPHDATPLLHTYAADFSDKVATNQSSQVSILAAEQDAGKQVEEEAQESGTKKALFVFSGVALLAIGGGGAYYAYSNYVANNTPIVVAPVTSAPIFFDEEEIVSGEGSTLRSALEQSATRTLTSGAVRLISSDNGTTTRKSLFVAAQFPAPQILQRNIQGEGSMMGIVNVGNTQRPFFILSVTSYNETFAGMLQWEATMLKDLATLFHEYQTQMFAPLPVVVATSTATSTTESENVLDTATTTPPKTEQVVGFSDEVVENHDVRVYRDESGQSVVLYGYWNRTTLVIARDTAAFTEILKRLANSQTQP